MVTAETGTSSPTNPATTQGDPFAGLPPIFREAAKEFYRYALDTPFIQGANVYATDGILAVWYPLAALRSEPHPVWSDVSKARPPVTGLFETHGPFAPAFHSLPDPSPYAETCKVCEGTGSTSHCIQCEMSFGKGIMIPCQACDGTCRTFPEGGMRVGRAILGLYYLDMLRRHGVAAVRIAADETKPAAAYIARPLWSGLLMPLQPDSGAVEDGTDIPENGKD